MTRRKRETDDTGNLFSANTPPAGTQANATRPDATPAAPENSPEEPQQEHALSVTEFTRRVKDILEQTIRPCWVRGEISNLRAQSSGHFYFILKDAGAQISAVLFRGDASRQTMTLRDGMQVVIYGQISVYEPRGQYQLIVRAVIEDGIGRLQREFEELKRRLATEGLFDQTRKVALPSMPATIGFITSPTGAAVQDFIRILTRRGWRGRLIILPAKVQGENASAEMIAMLREAEALQIFDLLVIGRGGGSLEDLWAFNEEPLVRAVVACPIPIISAVGHEIDFTLCDFAADIRAETPSGAAELISSRYIDCTDRLSRAHDALHDHAGTQLTRAREQLDNLRSHLRLLSPSAQIEKGFLQLDDLTNRLVAVQQRTFLIKHQHYLAAQKSLAHNLPEARVQHSSQRLLSLWKRLQAAGPQSVLNRGFVILRDETGTPLPRRATLHQGRPIDAQFADGNARLRVE